MKCGQISITVTQKQSTNYAQVLSAQCLLQRLKWAEQNFSETTKAKSMIKRPDVKNE